MRGRLYSFISLYFVLAIPIVKEVPRRTCYFIDILKHIYMYVVVFDCINSFEPVPGCLYTNIYAV